MEKELKSKLDIWVVAFELELSSTRTGGGGEGGVRKYRNRNRKQMLWCPANAVNFGWVLLCACRFHSGAVPQNWGDHMAQFTHVIPL